jgi:hypothetical protein
MSVLRYLVFVGIIYFLVTLLSTLLILSCNVALVSLRRMYFDLSYRVTITTCNAFVLYVLTSQIAILTVLTTQGRTVLALILFAAVGTLAIFWIATRNIYEKRKSGDYEVDAVGYSYRLHDDSILSVIAPVFFILSLFVSPLSSNHLTRWLFSVVTWVYDLRGRWITVRHSRDLNHDRDVGRCLLR